MEQHFLMKRRKLYHMKNTFVGLIILNIIKNQYLKDESTSQIALEAIMEEG